MRTNYNNPYNVSHHVLEIRFCKPGYLCKINQVFGFMEVENRVLVSHNCVGYARPSVLTLLTGSQ